MENEERFSKIEEAIVIMKDLVISHDNRLEKFLFALEKERQEREETNKDFNFKLYALIDAQLRNEADNAQLKESTKELRESTKELKEASQAQLLRIENLENQ